jgi:hypothetical protein
MADSFFVTLTLCHLVDRGHTFITTRRDTQLVASLS